MRRTRKAVAEHVRVVSKTMAALYDALEPTFGSRNASDLAFNCAEIYAELPELRGIVERSLIKKKMSRKDLAECGNYVNRSLAIPYWTVKENF
ncbi:MAG: hypothetical protein DME57_07755 [Verrucomicrobia bacterium]|nr:MAG: hypothetical protein DME57_07755 [Verrucomicrobiota bacterium]